MPRNTSRKLLLASSIGLALLIMVATVTTFVFGGGYVQTTSAGLAGPALPAATGLPGEQNMNRDAYQTVRERGFGAWRYTATRNQVEGLHATIIYDRETVSGIKGYAAASKVLLPEVVRGGGKADVAVTFVYPVSIDWFRTWAKANGLQVNIAMLRTGAPGPTGQGTVTVGGTADDPLPQSALESIMGGFFANNVYGVFGAYGTVDVTHLAKLDADPHVFLADATPTYVAQDLARAGVTETLRTTPRVELPFGAMERLGLENFTNLPIPTNIPAPVGTTQPNLAPPAPDH